jgi:RNA-directed DNA polymerase
MVVRVWDVRKSECRAVMVRIRVETLPGTKVSPRRTGLPWQDNLDNRQKEEKQMTTSAIPVIGASSAYPIKWNAINWQTVESHVRRLQMRIAKAIREKRYGKVKALQWLLTNSFYAKLLAVKRTTKNRGGKTAGVDGIVWKTPQQKMQAAQSLKRREYRSQPLRRVYIPKKSGKLRPLGIPVMKCRAMQALYLSALEPVAEMPLSNVSRPYQGNVPLNGFWREIYELVSIKFLMNGYSPISLWINHPLISG